MKKINSVQEYIALFKQGIHPSKLKMSNEKLEQELFEYLKKNKEKDEDLSFLYARCLDLGIGTDENIALAIAYYRILIEEKENKYAENNLGVCYGNGKGVAQDYSKAVYWYEKAAEQDLAVAQFNLGSCYYYRRGVAQDYNKAVYWYEKAAEQDLAVAQFNLGICYYYGRGVAQDYNKTFYWFEKAAEQGGSDAQYNLGYCYKFGQGVAQDYNKAVYWYEKAAEQGFAVAQCNLGYCYDKGQGVAQDYNKAVYWYEKAAKQGLAVAQFNLGICYYYGRGVAQDYNKAVYWYEKSANQGYDNAQKILELINSNSKNPNIKNQEVDTTYEHQFLTSLTIFHQTIETLNSKMEQIEQQLKDIEDGQEKNNTNKKESSSYRSRRKNKPTIAIMMAMDSRNPDPKENENERNAIQAVLSTIEKVASEYGTKAVPVNEVKEKNSDYVPANIEKLIKKADLVIVDITYNRCNCYYELGLVRGMGKEYILLCNKNTTPEFDVSPLKMITYKDFKDLKGELRERFPIWMNKKVK